MRDAFAPLDPTGCVLMVLTLDRYGTYSGERNWANAQEAYRDLSRLSNDLMARLRAWMKLQGWTVLKNQWVATVEMHKSGWPHVNFVVWSKELADWLEEEKQAKMSEERKSESDSRYVSGELASIVTAAGWGLLSTAERARSRDESLGYICKCAGKVDESIGELAKLTQLPSNAPFRFRRLRSGKGFLPPRKKSEAMTGTLVRRQVSQWGYDAIPVHNVSEKLVKPSEECCATEEQIWLSELEAEVRCARQVKKFGHAAVELPPVTHWFRKQRLENHPQLRKAAPYDERKPTSPTGPPPGIHRSDQVLPHTAGPGERAFVAA